MEGTEIRGPSLKTIYLFELYLVDTGYACAGVEVQGGVVTFAAPIFSWMRGKQWETVRQWKNIKRIDRA